MGSTLTILVDENIPFAEKLLAGLGRVIAVPGRNIPETALQQADILIIRSVTKIDQALIAQAPGLRFVGSCTIGTDHIDRHALSAAGIPFAYAPGCNANAVAEYVLSALLNQRSALDTLMEGGELGIVGMGNVGQAVARTMGCLGITCRYYDPLLPEPQAVALNAVNAVRAETLEDVMVLPVVTCHAPLTRDGPYPSFRMLGIDRLRLLPESAVLINAGRGGVMANEDLHVWLNERPDVRLVLDVWPGEPALDLTLLDRCAIATPHIAGYSQEGKVQGLLQVVQQMSELLNLPDPELRVDDLLGPPDALYLKDDTRNSQYAALMKAYDVAEDDRRMRTAMARAAPDGIALLFDQLRKNYPVRRELRGREIRGCDRALPIASLCKD